MSHLLTSYANFLKQKPYLGNSVSSALLFGTGDILAQVLFPKPGVRYDIHRTIRNAIYGGIIFSPLITKWYALLSRRIKYPFKTFFGSKPGAKQRTVLDTGCKVAADQLIWAPIGIPLYFGCMSLMEGTGLDGAKDKIDERTWDTLITNWKVWPLFQMFNFYFVKPAFRLLSVNLASILWNCYLSYENCKVSSSS